MDIVGGSNKMILVHTTAPQFNPELALSMNTKPIQTQYKAQKVSIISTLPSKEASTVQLAQNLG
jgi:hypothetical protein